MKYLCLIYTDEKSYAQLPEVQGRQVMGEYYDFMDWAKRNGYYVGSNRLEPTETATTVRIRNGKLSTTDGPFAETKEQLGGYFLVEAKDLNEALQIAARIPGARFGSVEVRPISEVPARAEALAGS